MYMFHYYIIYMYHMYILGCVHVLMLISVCTCIIFTFYIVYSKCIYVKFNMYMCLMILIFNQGNFSVKDHFISIIKHPVWVWV